MQPPPSPQDLPLETVDFLWFLSNLNAVPATPHQDLTLKQFNLFDFFSNLDAVPTPLQDLT